MTERNENLRHLFNGPPMGVEQFDLIRKADQDLLQALFSTFLQGLALGAEIAEEMVGLGMVSFGRGPEGVRQFLLMFLGAPEFDQQREAALRKVEAKL